MPCWTLPASQRWARSPTGPVRSGLKSDSTTPVSGMDRLLRPLRRSKRSEETLTALTVSVGAAGVFGPANPGPTLGRQPRAPSQRDQPIRRALSPLPLITEANRVGAPKNVPAQGPPVHAVIADRINRWRRGCGASSSASVPRSLRAWVWLRSGSRPAAGRCRLPRTRSERRGSRLPSADRSRRRSRPFGP